jgi:hypothetical protein
MRREQKTDDKKITGAHATQIKIKTRNRHDRRIINKNSSATDNTEQTGIPIGQ